MDWLPYLMAMVAAAATLWWGVPTVYADILRRNLRAKARDQHRVHLTFDDGPGRSLTPRVLDELDAVGAVATFFVLGRKAAEMGAIVREAAARGHVIGCHGFGHANYWFCSPKRAIDDVRRGWQALRDVLGVDPTRLPYRPPFGKLNLAVLLYLRLHRTPIWMWTADSFDTTRSGTDVGETLARIEHAGGGVILMHDHDRSQPERAEQILALVRGVGRAGDLGWRLEPIMLDARDDAETAATLATLRTPTREATTSSPPEPVGSAT